MYTCEEIARRVYRISEKERWNMYLIVGSQQALLIDTGNGFGNLKDYVRTLTDLPVQAALTHRHPDHCGGVWQFGSCCVHPQERDALTNTMCAAMALAQRHPGFAKKLNQSYEYIRPRGARETLLPMPEAFDLGGVTVRTEHLPGHTKGSVIFLDEQHRLIFTGDNINSSLWLQSPNAVPLSRWRESADRIIALVREGYTPYCGHNEGRQTLEQLEKTRLLAEQILEQAGAGRQRKGTAVYPDKETIPHIRFNVRRIF